MALSQIQCLDDNNVNPRTHESKPEFFYCEDQRLALEVLLRDGREAFGKYLEARELRGFLSDPELEVLARTAEPYDPGLELFSEGKEDDPTPLSIHYWPEMSDTSIPHMDMGWPDSDGYRGVTRTTVYTQPPMEGQSHIKEVVRKMIAQAQKVIAVVMDIFTDVDIFRDLLDASFKRKISVYILLERTTLSHFLSMCQRANMHTGHLKNLRVRCTGGADFLTRSCTRIRGRMGHRFMFIDGDKAMSGSYSFTWMSSRLDRHLITVTTGQAVDGFDRLFRFLYATSSSVDLRQIGMEPEPEPEPDPLPQPTMVAAPSAAVARKLINPKYALVVASNPSPTTSVGSPKETQDSDNSKKKRRKKVIEEDAPPLHPGLVGLEKAYLIPYLPIWPEPDPPSDVIGFINIRDTTRPTQVHLQRHEMFETSQAIRFSSPITMAKETLPEVAQPRKLTANHVELNKPQPTQNLTQAEELVVDKPKPTEVSVTPSDMKSKEEAPEQKLASSGQKFKPEKDTTEALNTVNKLHSNPATSQDVGHDTAYLSAQSSNKAPAPNKEETYHTAQTAHTNSLKSDSLPEANTKKEAETVSSLNRKSVVMYRTHVLKSKNVHTSKMLDLTDSEPNTEQDTQEKTAPSHADSHTQAVNMQPEISCEMTPNTQIPIVHSRISTSSAPDTPSVSSTSLSENNHAEFTTEHSSTDTTAPVPSTSSVSSLRPLPSTFAPSNPLLPSSPSSLSSSLTSAPPIPKPRTVQLVIKDSKGSNSQKLPEISVIKKTDTKAAALVFHNEPTVAPTSPVKEPETVSELQDHIASKTGAQKDTYNLGNYKETPPQKQSVASQETADKGADRRHDGGAEMQPVSGIKLQTQSDVLISDASKAARVNIQEKISKDVDSKTVMSRDCKIAPKTETDGVATVQKDTKASEKTLISSEFSTVPNEKDDNVTNCKANLAKTHEPERLSCCKLTPEDINESEDVDSVKAPAHTPVSTSPSPHISSVSAIDGIHTSAADRQDQQGKQARFTPAVSLLNTAKHNTDGTFQEQTPKARGSTQTPEKTLRLYLAETYVADLRSPTPERETRLLMGLVRTPTPDGFPSHASSPNSRTATPDFRTPTPDSALSTTSDEYYECSDSPFHEPVLGHMGFLKHGVAQDHVSYTPTNTPNASITGTSPACINYSPGAATLGTADTSCSGGPARVSPSSLLGKKVREPEVTANVEQEAETRRNTVERREEPQSQWTERRDGKEANRAVDHLTQDEDSTETAEKVKEAPKRRLMPSQSEADKPVDGGVTEGESTNETSTLCGPARVSSSSLHFKKVREPEITAYVEEDETRRNTVERREEPQSQWTERRDGEEANRAVGHLKQEEGSTETAEKVKEAPERRLMLSQSEADKPVDGGVTAGESTNETSAMCGPARVSSSSLHFKKVRELEVTANVEQEDETRRITLERKEQSETQETKRRDGEEANRAVGHLTQDEDSTETAEKVKEAPKRRLMPSQSKADKPVDGGVTAGESTNEATQPKVLRSTSDLETETVSSKGPDKVTSSREKASTQAALRPSGIERREGLQLTRENETLKLLHSPSKHQRVQQPDSGASSPSRPPRPHRSLSATQPVGPRPWASRQLSQTDGKVPHGSFQVDNTSSRRRSPSRLAPPGAVGSVGSGRRQVSSSQQGLTSRQPPAAQSRARPGQAQNQTQYPKPQASFLHTHSHLQTQPHPQQNQVAEEAHGQDEGKVPFSFTFSRLYSLKGLKDKMSKLPTQSKRGSTSSPVRGNKSSS